MTRPVALASLVVACACLAACSSDGVIPTVAPSTTAPAPPQPPTGRVVVLAATPIVPTLHILGDAFTEVHPGVEVAVTSGSANGLVNQISGGLEGDVFVSVGSDAIDALAVDGHLAVPPLAFATDPLVMIVPLGNPESLEGIAALANPERTIALCSLDSACGQASDAALMRAGLTASPTVLATDGAAVVQAVTNGRVTAGLAYRTDVTASVSYVDLGLDLQAEVPTIAARLAASTNPNAADAFIAFLFTAAAREHLQTIGLVPPRAAITS